MSGYAEEIMGRGAAAAWHRRLTEAVREGIGDFGSTRDEEELFWQLEGWRLTAHAA